MADKMNKIKFNSDMVVPNLTISGNLHVAGTSIAESTENILTKGAVTVINADNNELNVTLMGTVIRTGKQINGKYVDYAMVYDPLNESVRLGIGEYNSESNTFAFNEGEGLPIAVRDLSANDGGRLVMWDSANYRLVKAPISIDNWNDENPNVYVGDYRGGIELRGNGYTSIEVKPSEEDNSQMYITANGNNGFVDITAGSWIGLNAGDYSFSVDGGDGVAINGTPVATHELSASKRNYIPRWDKKSKKFVESTIYEYDDGGGITVGDGKGDIGITAEGYLWLKVEPNERDTSVISLNANDIHAKSEANLYINNLYTHVIKPDSIITDEEMGYEEPIELIIDGEDCPVEIKTEDNLSLKARGLVINEGNASGYNSIAGGTTDINLIKSVLGSGYAALIKTLGSNIAAWNDETIQGILEALDAGYTVEEFKRTLTISPSAAEGLLAISLGASNKSKSTAGISLGYGNISGGKGYYIADVNTVDKTITLSTKQDSTSAPSGSVNWAKGDRLFIVNDDRYWCEVDSVSGNVVTLKELPFTKPAKLKKYLTYNLTNPTERSVINIDKPESGEVDIGWGAIGIGALNTILGSNAFGVGYKNLIAGDFGATFGQENEVGYSAFAAGILNKALGKASLAIGDLNTAEGDYSQAFGYKTVASGKRSLASGDGCVASGENAVATGANTEASGFSSVALGEKTKATDKGAVAMGYLTSANADNSVAMGNGCHTYANSTFCGGLYSETSYYGTFVYGRKLKSSRAYQAVFGEESIDNNDALLIVGTAEDIGGNAFEVLKDGTAFLGGKKVATVDQLGGQTTVQIVAWGYDE